MNRPLFSVMKSYTFRNEFTPFVMSPIFHSVMEFYFLRHESAHFLVQFYYESTQFQVLHHRQVPVISLHNGCAGKWDMYATWAAYELNMFPAKWVRACSIELQDQTVCSIVIALQHL